MALQLFVLQMQCFRGLPAPLKTITSVKCMCRKRNYRNRKLRPEEQSIPGLQWVVSTSETEGPEWVSALSQILVNLSWRSVDLLTLFENQRIRSSEWMKKNSTNSENPRLLRQLGNRRIMRVWHWNDYKGKIKIVCYNKWKRKTKGEGYKRNRCGRSQRVI